MGQVWAVVCVVCLLMPAARAAADAPVTRVRGVGNYGKWVVGLGLGASPTVGALVRRLERSDVVVYVQIVPIEGGTAKTVLLKGDGPVRYLLVSIDHGRTPDVLIELLGHELQHAVEIAEAREVRDKAGLVALYQRIGIRRRATTDFETLLAREMGRRARHDLLHLPQQLYAARAR